MARSAEIVGAGFAGLTVAVALADRGWRVRVHEQADDLRAFGAGIFLWENGLGVLRALGVEDEALARSHEARRWEERGGDGSLMGSRALPLPGGLRMVTLTRGDLLSALVRRAQQVGVVIRTGSRAESVEADGTLRLADGGVVSADLVVGADGIRSAVRAGLGLEVRHEQYDLGLLRFLVPLDRTPHADAPWRFYVNFWDMAAHRRVLFVPCNDDDLYLLLGAAPEDPALRHPLDPAPWLASFPVLAPVLATLPTRPRHDRYESVHVERWSTGRVAVLGDAAHAMPPTIGQGAGTAMANALALAVAVADGAEGHDGVAEALVAWETDQRPGTEKTQQQSIELARTLFTAPERHADDWDEEVVEIARREPPAGRLPSA